MGLVVLVVLVLLASGCASSRRAKRGNGRIYRAPKCPCAWVVEGEDGGWGEGVAMLLEITIG